MKKIFLILIIFITSLFSNFFYSNFVYGNSLNLEIFGEDISGKNGDEVSILVKTKNFSGVAGLQIFMEYDKNFLEFLNIVEKNFNGTENFSEGNLKFLWDDFENPKNFSDNEKILELKFKILGENGSSEIKFGSNTKFFDVNGNEILSEKIDFLVICEKIENVNNPTGGGSSGFRIGKKFFNNNIDPGNSGFNKYLVNSSEYKDFNLLNKVNSNINKKYFYKKYFKPDDYLNRAEAAKIVWKIMSLKNK